MMTTSIHHKRNSWLNMSVRVGQFSAWEIAERATANAEADFNSAMATGQGFARAETALSTALGMWRSLRPTSASSPYFDRTAEIDATIARLQKDLLMLAKRKASVLAAVRFPGAAPAAPTATAAPSGSDLLFYGALGAAAHYLFSRR